MGIAERGERRRSLFLSWTVGRSRAASSADPRGSYSLWRSQQPLLLSSTTLHCTTLGVVRLKGFGIQVVSAGMTYCAALNDAFLSVQCAQGARGILHAYTGSKPQPVLFPF